MNFISLELANRNYFVCHLAIKK